MILSGYYTHKNTYEHVHDLVNNSESQTECSLKAFIRRLLTCVCEGPDTTNEWNMLAAQISPAPLVLEATLVLMMCMAHMALLVHQVPEDDQVHQECL